MGSSGELSRRCKDLTPIRTSKPGSRGFLATIDNGRQDRFQPLYEAKTHSIKADQVATVLGRKLTTVHVGEAGNEFSLRPATRCRSPPRSRSSAGCAAAFSRNCTTTSAAGRTSRWWATASSSSRARSSRAAAPASRGGAGGPAGDRRAHPGADRRGCSLGPRGGRPYRFRAHLDAALPRQLGAVDVMLADEGRLFLNLVRALRCLIRSSP